MTSSNNSLKRGNCQICNREKAITKEGVIYKHYVRTNTCPGSNQLPLQLSFMQIPVAIHFYQERQNRYEKKYIEHKKNRVNEPLPEWIFKQLSEDGKEAMRLKRRFKRIIKPLETSDPENHYYYSMIIYNDKELKTFTERQATKPVTNIK